MRSSLLLLGLTVAALATGGPATDGDAAADEAVLRKAGLGTDAAAVLGYFRQRTPDSATRARIAALIEQLGNNSFVARQQASAQLRAFGLTAVRQLRVATNDPDPEVAARAERCLAQIEKVPSTTVSRAAAHVLARLRPAGAAETLLAFLPDADDDRVTDEVIVALVAVAVRDGKPNAQLLSALRDPEPARRAAAAEALVRSGSADARSAALPLLQDPNADVRLRTALTFATVAQDKAAIPVLIDLLAELPYAKAARAQYLLCLLADDSAPQVALEDNTASRERCRSAWKEWWSAHAADADLARVAAAPPLLGQTLILLIEPPTASGQIVCLGADGKKHWSITGLRNPGNFQFLPPDHVLVAEVGGGRVAQYDLQGNRIWQHQISLPIGCQHLPDGSVFVVARNAILIVDKAGQVKTLHRRRIADICAGTRTPDGQVIVLTAAGQCQFLSADGQVKKSFSVGSVRYPADVSVLPNGRLLLTQTNGVAEFELDGQQVWHLECRRPTSAQRLPNGNTLITRQEGVNRSEVVEVDHKGEVLWRYKPADNSSPLRAARR